MTITDAALSIIVLGMMVLALGVDLAALFGRLRGRWHMPAPAPPAAGRWRRERVTGMPSKFKADDAIRDGSAKIASDLIASARKPSTAIEGDADEVI